ncbi:hypothetical protein SAMN04488071_1410 [Kordiimonas lacus]|uniref:Uncharacterized protein n=1 Tax=Kordiimonas lacus TaxID=637679 RepID=A0A1G6XXZ3_9PROT|nr:hypothetical protein SAMN04488071_1410 [Kordiimonas lacus]
MTEQPPLVEFERWETPFEFSDTVIFDVQYGNGGFYLYLAEGQKLWDLAPSNEKNYDSLTIRLFCPDDQTVYRIEFDQIGAHRVLDEGGLLQLWSSDERRKIRNKSDKPPMTFRVRGHGWSEESPVSFIHSTTDGWSFVISSSITCVEVLSFNPPEIIAEQKLSPQRPS